MKGLGTCDETYRYDYYGSLNLDWGDSVLYIYTRNKRVFLLAIRIRSSAFARSASALKEKKVSIHMGMRREPRKNKTQDVPAKSILWAKKNIWIKSKKYYRCSTLFVETFITLGSSRANGGGGGSISQWNDGARFCSLSTGKIYYLKNLYNNF